MKPSDIDAFMARQRVAPVNMPTRIASVRRPEALDLRALFVRAYPSFAAPCRAADAPGLALVAVHAATGRIAGFACVRAQVDRHVAVVIGRHDRCDLILSEDPTLALRQLVVVLGPVRSWQKGASDVSFQILDLRTSTPMIDETGRTLRGLRAEGPAMMRCAGYVLYALPLGDPTDWPASAADAWNWLPERVYFDELEHTPEASRVEPLRPPRQPHSTPVVRVHGPWDTAARLVHGDDLAGTLLVRGPDGGGVLPLGVRTLRDGVLLGRYARCDHAELCSDASLSRVHALVLATAGRLLLVDTASTNGTRVPGFPDARALVLRPGLDVALGTHTLVRWRPAT